MALFLIFDVIEMFGMMYFIKKAISTKMLDKIEALKSLALRTLNKTASRNNYETLIEIFRWLQWKLLISNDGTEEHCHVVYLSSLST